METYCITSANTCEGVHVLYIRSNGVLAWPVPISTNYELKDTPTYWYCQVEQP